MSISAANLNKIENEVVFRSSNERMTIGIENLKQIAEDEGQLSDVPNTKRALHYFCECSDENCRLRLKVKPELYRKLHKKNNHFIIVPGHAVSSIEKVILSTHTYQIVEKHQQDVPVKNVKLHRTDTNNV